MFNRKNLRSVIAVVLVNALAFGCGAKEEDKNKEDPSGTKPVGQGKSLQTKGLPDAGGISLAGMGKARGSLELTETDDENCDAAGDLGIFGFPLGVACHTTKIVRDVLYGTKPDSNGDGVISCADYDTNLKDQGILKALLCEQVVLNNPEVVSLKWDEDGRKHAISFLDYDAADDVNAVGSWTATGPEAGRYPANIRGWNAPSGSELKGLFGMKLSSGYAGSLELDLSEFSEGVKTEINFQAQEDTSKCAEAPSRDNCHYQDIKIKSPENVGIGGLAPGFHLSVLANEKQNADFIMLEGKVRYTKESAEQIFGNPADPMPVEFQSIREIYFRTVQKGNQVWGTFDMKDENGKTISSIIDNTDFPRVLRDGLSGTAYAGVCQNLGTAVIGDCRDIRYQDYDALWEGAEKFETVGADFDLKTDFSNPPSADGLVTK